MSENIAVFIDGDNVNSNDLKIILNEINNYGNINILQVYGDWSCQNLQNWLKVARNNGIIAIQCDRISGKNSSDIKMCIDIMNILYNVNHITLFYLVTSDSDFRHVINEIKKMNKKVYCIGSQRANNFLIKICDKYSKIEVLRKNNNKLNLKDILSEYRKDILSILDDLQDGVNLSKIAEILQRKYQFDYREYDCISTKSFMRKYFSDILNIYNNRNGCFIERKIQNN